VPPGWKKLSGRVGWPSIATQPSGPHGAAVHVVAIEQSYCRAPGAVGTQWMNCTSALCASAAGVAASSKAHDESNDETHFPCTGLSSWFGADRGRDGGVKSEIDYHFQFSSRKALWPGSGNFSHMWCFAR